MTATLVFDTSPLSHFARADRLDTLRQMTTGYRCTVTKAVLDEIAAEPRGIRNSAALI